ncbi:unnamed protein product [Thelazia callipaeda]|uniref:AraC family transcriptional regulator n=1 Tax=Thelazia callipaeda TaxID=103827 RepID=A0A0N5CNF1_THECL|nr:unnamed protein product [Thelazia callipaeda]
MNNFVNADALCHFLVKPLQSLPSPKVSSFILIDGIQKENIPLINQVRMASLIYH